MDQLKTSWKLRPIKDGWELVYAVSFVWQEDQTFEQPLRRECWCVGSVP